MFPGMSVFRCIASRRNLKNPHAEIFRAISLARYHTAGNAFGYVIVKICRRN
jgi:hypothetical protein